MADEGELTRLIQSQLKPFVNPSELFVAKSKGDSTNASIDIHIDTDSLV